MEAFLQWGCLALLIILSAFFSGAETALTTVNKMKIRSLAEEGDRRAKKLMKIHEKSGKMLSAILIGNNVINLSASALATIMALKISLSVGIMTLILTLVLLLFGEITPKNAAAAYAEPFALAVADYIWILMAVLTPAILVVETLSGGLLRLLRIDLSKADKAMTENELRTVVEVSLEDGVIERSERKIINNVVDFGDSRARDIMIPRIDVTEIEINAGYEDVAKLFREDMYSRIPVYAEDKDNVVGILHMKDVFFTDRESFRIRDAMREAYYTYELKRTSELLMDMKRESVTMAIVLNEYGAAEGIITMEDLLEEIVGEIRDEYDSDEEELIRKLSDREFDVDASMKLDDLNDALGTDFSSEDYDSLGGFVIEALDHLPQAGEQAETEDGTLLYVAEVERNRVTRVRITLPKPAQPDTVSEEGQ